MFECSDKMCHLYRTQERKNAKSGLCKILEDLLAARQQVVPVYACARTQRVIRRSCMSLFMLPRSTLLSLFRILKGKLYADRIAEFLGFWASPKSRIAEIGPELP